MVGDAGDAERRLMELEIRYSHLEHLVDELSALVRAQADELARLRRAMKELHGRVESLGEEGDMPHEKPPHY